MRNTALVVLALMVAACDVNEVQEPTTPPVVQLLTPAESQPADSSTRVTITATATGDFNPRVVVFRTSAGEFYPSGGAVANVPLSADGLAHVVLRPSPVAGIAMITATAGTTTVLDSIRFSAALVAPVWSTFEVTPDSVPADAASTVRLRARLSERGRRLAQQVKFTATAGRFTNSILTIQVPVDQDGYAEATLTAPETPGTAEVAVEAAGEVLRRALYFRAAPPFLTGIALSASSPPADGATAVVVTVTRDARAAHVTEAYISTTGGGFLPGGLQEDTLRFDAAGTAVTLLRVGDAPGLVLLRVHRGGQVLLDSLWLQPALPDALQVTGPAQLDVGKGESASIVATLRRAIGSPSAGIPVQMSARTPAGDSIGVFLSQGVSDAKDEASARWFLPDTTYTGTVLISARTLSAAGDTLVASYPLQVIKP